MFRAHRSFALLPALGALLGCPQPHADPTQKQPAQAKGPDGATSALAKSPRKVPEPLPNERVEIPGGSFNVGSRPGDPGRNPELEPRQTAIELARKRGIEVIERRIVPDELTQFSECFITGSAAEVTAVSEIAQWRFTPGAITQQLMADYTAEVQPKGKKAAA